MNMKKRGNKEKNVAVGQKMVAVQRNSAAFGQIMLTNATKTSTIRQKMIALEQMVEQIILASRPWMLAFGPKNCSILMNKT